MPPTWLPILILAGIGLPYVMLIALCRDRVAAAVHGADEWCRGRCEGKVCGYSLAGLGTRGQCPECGVPFDHVVKPVAVVVVWRWGRLKLFAIAMVVGLASASVPPGSILLGMLDGQHWDWTRAAAWQYLSGGYGAQLAIMVVNAWATSVFAARVPGVKVCRAALFVNAFGVLGNVAYAGVEWWLQEAWIARLAGLMMGWVVYLVWMAYESARPERQSEPSDDADAGDA